MASTLNPSNPPAPQIKTKINRKNKKVSRETGWACFRRFRKKKHGREAEKRDNLSKTTVSFDTLKRRYGTLFLGVLGITKDIDDNKEQGTIQALWVGRCGTHNGVVVIFYTHKGP